MCCLFDGVNICADVQNSVKSGWLISMNQDSGPDLTGHHGTLHLHTLQKNFFFNLRRSLKEQWKLLVAVNFSPLNSVKR